MVILSLVKDNVMESTEYFGWTICIFDSENAAFADMNLITFVGFC